jgi:hypothetical protein
MQREMYMKEEFTISESDYLKAQKLHSKPSKKDIYTHLAIISILLLAFIFGNEVVRAGGIGGIVGGVGCYFLHRYLVVPYNSKKHYRNYKSIQSTISFELLEDGFNISTVNTQSKVPLANIFKWKENEEYLLVYLMPKKQFSNSETVKKLVELLNHGVGKSA